MSSSPALRAAVLRAVASACPRTSRGQVDEHASFAGLGLDSLDRITLAVAVEETTGKRIADEALPRLRTVSDLISHLSAQGDST